MVCATAATSTTNPASPSSNVLLVPQLRETIVADLADAPESDAFVIQHQLSLI